MGRRAWRTTCWHARWAWGWHSRRHAMPWGGVPSHAAASHAWVSRHLARRQNSRRSMLCHGRRRWHWRSVRHRRRRISSRRRGGIATHARSPMRWRPHVGRRRHTCIHPRRWAEGRRRCWARRWWLRCVASCMPAAITPWRCGHVRSWWHAGTGAGIRRSLGHHRGGCCCLVVLLLLWVGWLVHCLWVAHAWPHGPRAHTGMGGMGRMGRMGCMGCMRSMGSMGSMGWCWLVGWLSLSWRLVQNSHIGHLEGERRWSPKHLIHLHWRRIVDPIPQDGRRRIIA